MSATDLLAGIVAREDSSIELREVGFRGSEVSGPGRDQLADELAAFANGRGGTLVLGADDESREILGIPLEKLDSVERTVTKVCADWIDPPLDATTKKRSLPDSAGISRWVVRVDVERSLSVHRSPGGYFRRLGSSKRKMAKDQLGRLFEQRSRDRLIRFDATVVARHSPVPPRCGHAGAVSDGSHTGQREDARCQAGDGRQRRFRQSRACGGRVSHGNRAAREVASPCIHPGCSLSRRSHQHFRHGRYELPDRCEGHLWTA